MTGASASRWQVGIALGTIYLVWGSTYLAVRIALAGFPPFLLGGIRFTCAGALLLLFLTMRGEKLPPRREIVSAGLVGALLLGIGNGGVVYAEQTVASGLTALGVATVPLWVALFGGIWRVWPTKIEWLGMLLGFAGMVLLNLDGGLRASPAGAAAILISSAGWSFGSVWGKRLPLPKGFMNSAIQMLVGGCVMLVEGVVCRERIAHVPPVALWNLVYLVLAGIAGYSSYVFLLAKTRPALATSYAYVNPIVAMFLGAVILSETVTHAALIAMVLIVGGVALVASSTKGNVDTHDG